MGAFRSLLNLFSTGSFFGFMTFELEGGPPSSLSVTFFRFFGGVMGGVVEEDGSEKVSGSLPFVRGIS